jgi:hypothetical protein
MVPFSFPVAAGQPRTFGTATRTPLLATGSEVPPALDAVTEHVNVSSSSLACIA